MAKQDGSRIFTARVHPERDAELYRAIASRVDSVEDGGQGMTFKELLQLAIPLAFPAEFSGGASPAVSADYVPPARPGADGLDWEGPAEEPRAEEPPPVAAGPESETPVRPAVAVSPGVGPSPAGSAATPGLRGYGLDDRLDANLRREYLP